MKYRKIIIHEYRGIRDPIEFNLERESIFPLVGVNECGKTTILEAILAFDHTADKQNGGRHLKDVENLYSLKKGLPRVSAEIQIEPKQLITYFKKCQKEVSNADALVARLVVPESDDSTKRDVSSLLKEFDLRVDRFLKRPVTEDGSTPIAASDIEKVRDLRSKRREQDRIRELTTEVSQSTFDCITITRNLGPGIGYKLDCGIDLPVRLQNRLAQMIVADLDYILYFDDFRHDVPERISIKSDSKNEWTSILSTLFQSAHEDLNLFELPSMDPRRRQTAIAKAEKSLNKTLTAQWEKFHLEDKKSLEIRVNYHEENGPEIELDIKERSEDEDEFFFGIKDRSKGFFWFFNFVMRLEFNPKKNMGEGRIIYLLDEPGSYLHARAQDKLCTKLMELSRTSQVFYCTHSHHLIDPHVIPFNSIRIVEKSESKEIAVKTIHSHNSDRRKDAAFQPIFEALQIRPAALDLDQKRVLVVEGLYDFLAYDMFKTADMAIVPAVNANSIQYHISWLLAWGVDYRALWDNDEEGREKFEQASSYFGAEEANRSFRLIPLRNKKKRRLEELFDDADLSRMKSACNLPNSAKFNKVLLAVYYSVDRKLILDSLGTDTKKAFEEVFKSLWST